MLRSSLRSFAIQDPRVKASCSTSKRLCLAADLHSINKGNCESVPLIGRSLQVPSCRNFMIALVAGGGFEPPTFGL